MSYHSERILAALLPASALVLTLGLAANASAFETLPLDRPTQVSGVHAACTGIGAREEHNKQWRSYPVKLEAVNRYGQYLGDEDLTVKGRGNAIALQVRCDAPWILMGLEPGKYDAVMQVPNAPERKVVFTVLRRGQRDVVVRFSSLGEGYQSDKAS